MSIKIKEVTLLEHTPYAFQLSLVSNDETRKSEYLPMLDEELIREIKQDIYGRVSEELGFSMKFKSEMEIEYLNLAKEVTLRDIESTQYWFMMYHLQDYIKFGEMHSLEDGVLNARLLFKLVNDYSRKLSDDICIKEYRDLINTLQEDFEDFPKMVDVLFNHFTQMEIAGNKSNEETPYPRNTEGSKSRDILANKIIRQLNTHNISSKLAQIKIHSNLTHMNELIRVKAIVYTDIFNNELGISLITEAEEDVIEWISKILKGVELIWKI